MAASAEKSAFKEFAQEHFPHPKMATKVLNKLKSGAILSSESIEKWVPQYIGADLPAVAQKKLVADREKLETLTLAQLLENSSAFWLTHGVANKVTPIAVLRHMMLLVKIASEHSTAVAVQYERTLLQHIRNMKGSIDMSSVISEKVDAVETTVNNHFSQKARPKAVPPIIRDTQAGGPSFKAEAQTNKKVCFWHNPSAKSVCRRGDQCPFEHVDTMVPNEKRRFEKARLAARR